MQVSRLLSFISLYPENWDVKIYDRSKGEYIDFTFDDVEILPKNPTRGIIKRLPNKNK